MALLDNNSYIHFRKTTSVEFAAEFPWFADWLYETDKDGFVNIQSIDSSRAVLSPKRHKSLPIYEDPSISDSSLNSGYFLDDIRIIYYRGIPYDSAQDYITTAEYTDSSFFSVDPDRHILYIPNPNKQDVEFDISNLGFAYIHQLDETGAYNPNDKDSSITVYVKGESGKTFTIQQSMVKGEETDDKDTVSYWGLKKYVDEKISGSSGGGTTYVWQEEI